MAFGTHGVSYRSFRHFLPSNNPLVHDCPAVVATFWGVPEPTEELQLQLCTLTFAPESRATTPSCGCGCIFACFFFVGKPPRGA
jgi:hypothetical protein